METITEDAEYSSIEDPTRATITTSTRSKLPLILPWHPEQMIPLGTMFQSDSISDPWMKNSPFDTDSLRSAPIILQHEDGTENSFKSHSTSRTSATHDHLSLGLGVGVGLPFLAQVSVSGTYDKDVLENNDVGFVATPLTDSFLAVLIQVGMQDLNPLHGPRWISPFRTTAPVVNRSDHHFEICRWPFSLPRKIW